MLKRMLAMALTLGLAIWVVTSCSSNNNKVTTTPTGSMFTFVEDTPFCGIVNFRAQIESLSITLQGNTTPTLLFGGVSTKEPLYKVNFGGLKDFSTLLDISTVPAGTYDRAIVTFGIPQLITYDPTFTPVVGLSQVNLSTISPQFSINPPLVITAGQVTGLHMEFNLRESVILDNQGQLTSSMTPVMTFSPISPSTTGGFGDMDDMTGFVTSVSSTSSGLFTGGFGFQTLSGTGPLVTANLTNSSLICGPTTTSNQPCLKSNQILLNQLLTGSFVEMDGYVDPSGNLVANTVEVEDREAPELNQLAFIGNVIPNTITRDSSGNVTQFGFYVREEEPDVEFGGVGLDTIVTVNVSPSTIYQYSSRSTNFASLPFDASSIQEGQELVVHGVFTVPTTSTTIKPPTTVVADKVYVKLQSHQGNFSSLVAAQADDKTGAFWMVSCSTLFEGAPILVLTNGPAGNTNGFAQTGFLNLNGLSSLTPLPALLVKGLLFYEAQGGTVNGVTVPPGTLVLLAKQVHKLD